MKQARGRQYTIRGVPPGVDRALREQSRRRGCSLNELLLRALHRFVGMPPDSEEHHDLDDLPGSWVDDSEFDAALAEQRRIDRGLWQ